MKRNHDPQVDPAPVAGAIAASVVLAAAACAVPTSLPESSSQAIGRCLTDLASRTGRALSPEADRAYVYARGETWWIHFTHGDSGTFGRRSDDYHILLTCGIVHEKRPTVVFLGEPMQDPIFDSPGRDAFVTPEGATELLFERAHGRFEYCCSQPFDRRNVQAPPVTRP